MGRTTFLPALEAPAWPWTQPVFVLTSRPLPEGTPDHVTTAPTPAALLKAMETAGVTGDVHLVGGPCTMQAFRDIGALAEVGLLVIHASRAAASRSRPPGPSRCRSRCGRRGRFQTASSRPGTRLEADRRARQAEEPQQDVSAPLVADLQAPVADQQIPPGKRPR
jgi:hypothetical protein